MPDLIRPETLRDWQGAQKPVVIDVRAAAEYAAGSVPGARHIPADALEGRLAELPLDRPIVTYCSMRHRGASRSERAAALLRANGFDASALDGGLPAWEAAGGAVEPGR